MRNLNTLFLNDIYNSFYKNTPSILEDLEIFPQINSELRSYNINLGRGSGKTTAIINFITQHPETRFVFYSPNTVNVNYQFRNELINMTNCSLLAFSDYFSRVEYDIVILEDYTGLLYNKRETLGLFENSLYTRMNSNKRKDQIYIKVG